MRHDVIAILTVSALMYAQPTPHHDDVPRLDFASTIATLERRPASVSRPAHKVAERVCVGGSHNRRVAAGTLPDLFFVVGRPDTQYVRPVKLNFVSDWPAGPGYSDCQGYARSNVSGVSLRQSYGAVGSLHGPGQWAGIDQSSGPINNGEPNRYFPYWGFPAQATGRVQIIYDGTGTRRAGTIDIAVNQAADPGFDMRIIGSVNVFILPAPEVTTALTVTATSGDISAENFTLDHPLLNGEASTRVFVQHADGVGVWNHPIAVWFDAAVDRWKIRNEDGTPMPVGIRFNVRIDPSAMLLNTAPQDQSHYIIIRHPDADGNPYATIIVTPVSSGDRRMIQPFAVAYVHPYWQVLTPAPMPTTSGGSGAGYHVKVLAATHYVDDSRTGDPSGLLSTQLSNGAGIDIVASSNRLSGGMKLLSHWCWSTNSISQPIIVTANWTPLPPPLPINYNWVTFKHFGVGLRGSIATVFHEDGSFMDGRVALNVWGPYRPDCP
jgi:hypothetical protein